jgi:hypothetical protein
MVVVIVVVVVVVVVSRLELGRQGKAGRAVPGRYFLGPSAYYLCSR